MNIRYRIIGHAGLWTMLGQALVLGDEEEFEHDQVLMQQIADPDRMVVVAQSEITVYDSPTLEVAV